MRNVQQRQISASAAKVGLMLDTFASAEDQIWPAGWPPAKLVAGLSIGSKGAHGPIRYSVEAYEPGRHIRLKFAPGVGIDGYHEFVLKPVGDNLCLVTHTVEGPLNGWMRLGWPVAMRWLHDALLQDLLDNIELGSTGRLRNGPAHWSPWVRFLRRLDGAPPQCTLAATGRVVG